VGRLLPPAPDGSRIQGRLVLFSRASRRPRSVTSCLTSRQWAEIKKIVITRTPLLAGFISTNFVGFACDLMSLFRPKGTGSGPKRWGAVAFGGEGDAADTSPFDGPSVAKRVVGRGLDRTSPPSCH